MSQLAKQTPMVIYEEKTNSCHCLHCLEAIEVPRRVAEDPEARIEFVELVTLDHAECPKYNDVEAARKARQFRKTKKRLMIIDQMRYGRLHL